MIQADAYNERLFSVSSEEPAAKQAYLQEISDNALHKRNIELTENDHLVLLITCTSDMTNGRNILVGRLTDQVYPEKEKAKNLGTGIDKLKEKMIQVPVIYWILLLIIVLLLIDRKLKKKERKNMKILDLKKTAVILVTMLLFLSMQISAFASDNCTVVKIPVRQIFDSEVEGIADEFSYIMTTDQSDAPMPAGSRNMQYSWTMEKNAATEIILNVKTAGQYHYNIYQTTEKKDDYKYDQNRYYVTVEAYYNESNQLKVVTIVANEKGEKIEAISFKNSYMGEEKPNLTQPSNPSQPSYLSYSDGLGKPIA